MMFDPSGMYPDLYHPVRPEKRRDFNGKATHYSRTQRPPKYYLIDFGLSRRYEDDISTVVEPVIVGGDRTAPEHAEDRGATPCNPFQTDVYYIGNMVREEFIRVRPLSPCTLLVLLNPARRKLTISSSWHHSSETWSRTIWLSGQLWMKLCVGSIPSYDQCLSSSFDPGSRTKTNFLSLVPSAISSIGPDRLDLRCKVSQLSPLPGSDRCSSLR
jgi:hypothetical protein